MSAHRHRAEHYAERDIAIVQAVADGYSTVVTIAQHVGITTMQATYRITVLRQREIIRTTRRAGTHLAAMYGLAVPLDEAIEALREHVDIGDGIDTLEAAWPHPVRVPIGTVGRRHVVMG